MARQFSERPPSYYHPLSYNSQASSQRYGGLSSNTAFGVNQNMQQYYTAGPGNFTYNQLSEFLISILGSDQAKKDFRQILDSPQARTFFGKIITHPGLSKFYGGSNLDIYRSAANLKQNTFFTGADGGKLYTNIPGTAHLQEQLTSITSKWAERTGTMKGHASSYLRAMLQGGALQGTTLTETGVDKDGNEIFGLSKTAEQKMKNMFDSANKSLRSMKELFGGNKNEAELIAIAEEVTGKAFNSMKSAEEMSKKINQVRITAEMHGYDSRNIGNALRSTAAQYRQMGMSADQAGFVTTSGFISGLGLARDTGMDAATATSQMGSVIGQVTQSREYQLRTIGQGVIEAGFVQDPQKIKQIQEALAQGNMARVATLVGPHLGRGTRQEHFEVFDSIMTDKQKQQNLIAAHGSERIRNARMDAVRSELDVLRPYIGGNFNEFTEKLTTQDGAFEDIIRVLNPDVSKKNRREVLKEYGLSNLPNNQKGLNILRRELKKLVSAGVLNFEDLNVDRDQVLDSLNFSEKDREKFMKAEQTALFKFLQGDGKMPELKTGNFPILKNLNEELMRLLGEGLSAIGVEQQTVNTDNVTIIANNIDNNNRNETDNENKKQDKD